MLNRGLTITAFIVLVAKLAFCPVVEAQPVKERPDRLFAFSFDAAAQGRDDVKRLVPTPNKSQRTKDEDDAYAKALGFDSAQQAGDAQLGGSLSIYMSRLDWFKNANPETFENLVITTGRIIYTLHVNGDPKSSVTVTRDSQTGQWRVIEWGSRRLIRLLEQQRMPHPGISFFLLISPANPWGLRFVGEERAGQFFLTPLTDIKEIDLRGGEEVSAATFVAKLKALADQLPKQ